MLLRILHLSLTVLAVLALMTDQACAVGFILGQTKDELELKYDVSVQDHGPGRVTIVFTLTAKASAGSGLVFGVQAV